MFGNKDLNEYSVEKLTFQLCILFSFWLPKPFSFLRSGNSVNIKNDNTIRVIRFTWKTVVVTGSLRKTKSACVHFDGRVEREINILMRWRHGIDVQRVIYRGTTVSRRIFTVADAGKSIAFPREKSETCAPYNSAMYLMA